MASREINCTNPTMHVFLPSCKGMFYWKTVNAHILLKRQPEMRYNLVDIAIKHGRDNLCN